ncbi:MAG: hypothetical protein B7Z72_01510 [Gemmatimonadetes bacterium 21-71-4]|nr:MAG: hypothetical protein B7Z72_01510 [Gemmatimonadetes bacterium 21-71-4]
MRVYRICAPAHAALDGAGAEQYGGRWNSPGRRMVYTAGHVSLAVVEALVHVDAATAPLSQVLLTIDVPDDVRIVRVDAGALGAGWQTESGIAACRAAGDAWLAAGRAAVLAVPSAPIPEETNYLMNPAHVDAARIRVVERRAFSFDERLL